jgi:hypothetical protein
VRRAAADVPLLGAVRERVEPDLLPRGEGSVCVEWEAGALKEAGRRRERLPGATTFVKPATTTSLTQRDLTRSLAFPCAVSFL